MNKDKEKKLASILINHSLEVKKGDKVLLQYQSEKCSNLIKECIKEIINNGGIPYIDYTPQSVYDYLRQNYTDEIIVNEHDEFRNKVENYDCFLRLYYNENDYYDKFINPVYKNKLMELNKPFKEIMINEKRWVLLNYPSLLDSNKAKMLEDEFYDYSMDSMTVDYKKMNESMQALKKLMEKTDKVHIIGPNTDISFSIKNMPAIICSGEKNIPDGECYSAPVKDSVNGTITYNTKSPYAGEVFENISLTFKNGKIVDCSSNNIKKMNEIFDTDEGARYVGEFSLGVNPMIMEPMGDILFDEKIAGSLHFTPGCSYDDCNNGNKSNVHWDLVLIQRSEYGGGEIYFDDKLIRKDGVFLIDELKPLNFK